LLYINGKIPLRFHPHARQTLNYVSVMLRKSFESATDGPVRLEEFVGQFLIWESVAGLAAALKQARRVGDVVAATSSKTEQVALNNCSFFSSCSLIQNSPYTDHWERKESSKGSKALVVAFYEHQRYRLTSTKSPSQISGHATSAYPP
jgi:hypothetical protein